MANGGSPLPSPHTTSSSMPHMPRPSAALSQTPSASLLQPHEHHLRDRASFETLTSIASSNPAHPSAPAQQQLRPGMGARAASYPPQPEHLAAHASGSRPGQVRPSKYHFHRSSSHSLAPPLRDLPPLHPPHEAVQWRRRSSAKTDQLLEGSSDDDEAEEMILQPPGLDLSLGRLYGFPYCMGVPDAFEQRSKAVAEAEEAEYQREKEGKQKARRSQRVSSVFKDALPWSRRR